MNDESFMECPRCQGQGLVPLTPTYRVILASLKKDGPATPPQLAQRLSYDGTPTAFNNQLEKMRAAGLVRRRKQGGTKARLYRAIPNHHY